MQEDTNEYLSGMENNHLPKWHSNINAEKESVKTQLEQITENIYCIYKEHSSYKRFDQT